jgi:hypothetical protein
MNMPALTATLEEMVEAVSAFDFPGRRGSVIWARNDEFQGLIESWPHAVLAEEAQRLGLKADDSIADILRGFIDDYALLASR